MVVSEFMHEALCQIGLIWCGLMVLPGLLYILWKGCKTPCKQFIHWGIWKLDRAMKKAETSRIRREKASMFYAEHISGTCGYRIKTR